MNSDILGFSLHDPGYLNAHWMSVSKRSFYRAANADFGKVSRTATGDVALQLVLSKCVSVLLKLVHLMLQIYDR